ncbi:MAG: N-acetyltransferase [Desulfotalea sp.]
MYVILNNNNIDAEHICCAFSDKKCTESYKQKKDWLKKEFKNGYIFQKLDERAKVFIEYGPAENAWLPITAPGYMNIGCFWVSGKYKKNGHGKKLLQEAINAAESHNMHGLVTVVGKKKFHFMSDTKWLIRQGFKIVEELPSGFILLTLNIKEAAPPFFNKSTKIKPLTKQDGCVAYYSNRCPYAAYHVEKSLTESCQKRNIPLKVVKFKTMEEAKAAPSPATIFSLFYNGKFITTDISACMDSRFDKLELGL